MYKAVPLRVPAICENLGDATTTDECLCYDNEFLTNSALGIFANCGCTDLIISADLLVSICEEYAGGISMSFTEIIAAGDGGNSACESSSANAPTTTPAIVLQRQAAAASFMTTEAFEPGVTLSAFSSPTSFFSTTTEGPSSASPPSAAPSSATTTSSGTDSGGKGGLSPGATAAVAVISAVTGRLCAAVALWACFFRE